MSQNNLSFACIPFNFSQFEAAIQKIGDFDTTLLYASLQFQIDRSKLFPYGTQTIARSRPQLASRLNLTLNKIDKGIKVLEKIDFIKKTVKKWYNKKRLYISREKAVPKIEVHFHKLSFLEQFTGSSKASFLWAKIAFALNNTRIEHENMLWCTFTRETLAKLLCVSLRKVDSIIDDLEKKGLIISRNFVWHEKRQLHFTIPQALYEEIEAKLSLWLEQYNTQPPKKTVPKEKRQEIIESIENADNDLCIEEPIEREDKSKKEPYDNNNIVLNQLKETIASDFPTKKAEEEAPGPSGQMGEICPNSGFCSEVPAKTEKSIRLNDFIQYSNSTIISKNLKKEKYDTSDVTLNHIHEELTYRQLCFLREALKRTIEKAQLTINEQEIFEEIKYNILNPAQRKGILSFKHAVSRCMQLLRQRTWRTPFGFHRYTEYGKERKSSRERQLQAHEALKQEECYQDSKSVSQTNSYTAQAIKWAQQLRTYLHDMPRKMGGDADLMLKIDFAVSKIREFISKGADKLAIKPYLPSEIAG